jgi:hypothetical protein
MDSSPFPRWIARVRRRLVRPGSRPAFLHVWMPWATSSLVFLALHLVPVTSGLAADRSDASGRPIDFNRDIRPILSENCFYCHGQDAAKRQADLRLDERSAAVDAGAIAPGEPGASSLLERIHSSDPDVLMPPPDSNRRLSDSQKALLERWIAAGAAYDMHWAFVPPSRPPLPMVEDDGWVRTPVDRFVLAVLEDAGLEPSPEADRATLIRRLSLDLLGLPPTPAEIDAFAVDEDPQAYEKLVDRLLASPHYGERMALPWLDAARYADSNGFQQDGDTWQWIWRDWVVASLNADMPFDRFSIEQLAGDLLPDATNEQRIASGFNRNHLLNGEGGAIPEEQRFVNLFDRVDTTSTTWLGLTMACAQCHDHKYDPATKVDYYRMLDLFNRVPESGVPTFYSSRIRVAPPVLELPTTENTATIADFEKRIAELESQIAPVADVAFVAWRKGVLADGKAEDAGLPEGLVALLAIPESQRSDEQTVSIDQQLRAHFDASVGPEAIASFTPAKALLETRQQLDGYRKDRIPRVMVMSDEMPRETRELDRGDYLSPIGEPLAFAPPAFLPPLPEGEPANRLGFARWLFLPEHPLTARVQVNRMWQMFFGTGLVKTTEDMGVQSEYPIHGDLLDWLAVEFREQGWSLKRMHRLLVTSATYRQSSRLTPEQMAADPENRLHGCGSRFRMPSMVLRDVALSAAGLLEDAIGGPPVYPYQPDGIWESLAITKERDFTYPASHGGDLYRRSLYTFWRRTVAPANMFDVANRRTCTVRATRTSTPLHALTTLNDPTWVEASRSLAERSMLSEPDLPARLRHAFRQVLGRRPADDELASLGSAFERQHELYRADPALAEALLGVGESPRDASLDAVEHAALTAVCLAILNLDEALTRE